jgi:hypothetical protein
MDPVSGALTPRHILQGAYEDPSHRERLHIRDRRDLQKETIVDTTRTYGQCDILYKLRYSCELEAIVRDDQPHYSGIQRILGKLPARHALFFKVWYCMQMHRAKRLAS